MANVTSVVLTFSCIEPGFDRDTQSSLKLAKVNAFLAKLGHAPLSCITPHLAGDKVSQVEIFGGAYGLLPNDDFLDLVKSIDWDYPAEVVLTMHTEMNPLIVWQPTA